MQSKGIVLLASLSRFQSWSFYWPIFPVIKTPEKTLEKPTMVFYDTQHNNEIGYCRKFTNDVRNQNMQSFLRMDARIEIYESKNMADPWDAYSALGRV